MLTEAAAAKTLVLAGDPGAAAAAGRVEQHGRAALDDMRRLLGVLREGDEAIALAPQPTLAQLDALGVGVTHDGSPRALPPGLDLAAYRVVEDALAHAERSAGVIVHWRPAAVELEIAADGLVDDATIRERVELFGGTLRTSRGSLLAILPDTGGAP
jgi:signal transduction histidine kinase